MQSWCFGSGQESTPIRIPFSKENDVVSVVTAKLLSPSSSFAIQWQWQLSDVINKGCLIPSSSATAGEDAQGSKSRVVQ
jgi:hypothetical protein